MTGDRPAGGSRHRDEATGASAPDVTSGAAVTVAPPSGHAPGIHLGAVIVLALLFVGGGTMGLHHWDTVRAEREVVAAEAARQQTQRELELERRAYERAERAATARSERRQERLARTRLAVVTEAGEVRPSAAELLAASEGLVDDEEVRTALAAAIGVLDAAVEASVVQPAVVRMAIAEVTSAQAAVAEARDRYEERAEASAEPEEADAEADSEADNGDASATEPSPARSGGAGPDCGGPDSYEPPSGDATFFTSTPAVDGDGGNGRLPRDRMSPLGWCVDSQGNAQWLRADAAAALTELNAAFRAKFGENIAIDMSYRSYTDQVAMREHYGSIAARPGTSNHGWGTAFDTWEWAAYSFGSARYEWLVEHGPAYGWVAPSWARQGGANPEYWHFEYVG